MRLTYKGTTVPVADEAIIRDHEFEPAIRYFLSIPVKASQNAAFLKTGVGTGTLAFKTGFGPVSMRVPLKITRHD